MSSALSHCFSSRSTLPKYTLKLWLHLGCHFVKLYPCATKQWLSNEIIATRSITQYCWIRKYSQWPCVVLSIERETDWSVYTTSLYYLYSYVFYCLLYFGCSFVILLQKGGASTDAWVIQCYKCKYLSLTVHNCSRWQISTLACACCKKKSGTNK